MWAFLNYVNVLTLIHILYNKKFYYRFAECHLTVIIN